MKELKTSVSEKKIEESRKTPVEGPRRSISPKKGAELVPMSTRSRILSENREESLQKVRKTPVLEANENVLEAKTPVLTPISTKARTLSDNNVSFDGFWETCLLYYPLFTFGGNKVNKFL